jgi:hypothetical protein
VEIDYLEGVVYFTVQDINRDYSYHAPITITKNPERIILYPAGNLCKFKFELTKKVA